jgi:thiol-disulfide isomerase/thioredoxin
VEPRKLLFAGTVILALSVGWIGARYFRAAGGAAPAETAAPALTLRFFKDPATVPSFTARDLDGRAISSESFRGKVTIVNFWATWCPPCRAEIPDLIALQSKYGDQLQIIGISQDEIGPEEVKRFVADQHMNYPVVMSTPELEHIFSGVYALPTSFVLDRDLKIVQKHVGLLVPATTEGEVRSLAGLSVNAVVERIDATDDQKKLIKDAAQATKIPGVDLDALSPTARAAALKQLNADSCTCGCGLTLAACRINDPGCNISLPLAQKIVENLAHQ